MKRTPFDVIPDEFKSLLTRDELNYIQIVNQRFRGFPPIKSLWKLMDEQWSNYKCNPLIVDERISAFYNHPVWLLNGLFIENDSASLRYRSEFVKSIQTYSPLRIADYGGGFGTLARMLGHALPDAQIEIVEPYPHPIATAFTDLLPNVHYVSSLNGNYDFIISTDVLEHVIDPLDLVVVTSAHLGPNGIYMMANCFSPVIKCHLPQHAHFQYSWDLAMQAMGLTCLYKVHYASFYKLSSVINLPASRIAEKLSRRLYKYVKWIPLGSLRLRAASLLFRSYA